MRPLHIEPDKHDGQRKPAHQQRQVHRLKPGILPVMDPVRITRKARLLTPLDQAKPKTLLFRQLVVARALANVMARPALTLEIGNTATLTPPGPIASVQHIRPGQEPAGILDGNHMLPTASLGNLRSKRRSRRSDDH